MQMRTMINMMQTWQSIIQNNRIRIEKQKD
jgi:hypothetical protein